MPSASRSRRHGVTQTLAGLVLATGFLPLLRGASPSPALVHHPSGTPVEAGSIQGSICVVDFFAHWCVPCLNATRALQTEVGAWYRSAGGTPSGIPVRVIAVNVDGSAPARTARFVTAAGASEVWEDVEGRWHAALGGDGLPFVVVLDARRATSPFEAPVAARFSGAVDPARVREAIDRIGAPSAAPSAAGAGSKGTTGEATDGGKRWFSAPSVSLLECGGEWMGSEDVALAQGMLAWRQQWARWDYLAQVQWQGFDLDYAPAPLDSISRARNLREDTFGFQGRVRTRFGEGWQAEMGGGLTEGFSDFRSLWLDHYYRQFFGRNVNYREADPRGFNVAPGMRWEVRPGAAYLQATFVYQHDTVSPGYEKEPLKPLVRGTSELDTVAGALSLEHVVDSRSRLSHEARITDTTNRDLRYGYKGSWNWVAMPSVVVRTVGGVSWEPPRFLGWFAQTGIEKDWQDRWFAGAFFRYYSDDGLVQDPRVPSNAAPPLYSVRSGLSARFQGRRLSARFATGPYLTRYAPLPAASSDFAVLYADRDWWFVESAVGWNF